MTAIEKYFSGEKGESYLFLIMGIIALIFALYFVLFLKQPFWKGVAIPFVVIAILEITVGATIVARTPADKLRVETIIKNEPSKINSEEIPRMQKVMKNFIVFRYTEIVLILIGIILMYALPQYNFWKGIGLGLFLQASIVLALDFFAEKRGSYYLDYLTEFVQKI